ncbi:MAG TPA: MBOAT family O-acyltransferase [Oligoflexus sp.]|uniref:MBOAT family O-acyltransferase n=1 Tax=Oligoflexus sp. TaxID=1971216 RepID=UPI002D24D12A|nr:MBOAT family O-acyltransferase [Oligoflexus sp.]HYX35060.1 MBOAT family O-acyltransferase [Oligoflexus sp.]
MRFLQGNCPAAGPILQINWLLLASCYFYMALVPKYILILFAIILLDYFAAIVIEKVPVRFRKLVLVLSLVANISFLAAFKYLSFLSDNATSVLGLMGINVSIDLPQWILPIGLSFHTFQSMAYTIEVYRGRYPAERDLFKYALYVLFWPQMVAGPIERPSGLLDQIRETKKFDADRITDGLRMMLIGFFKKIVVADRFGAFADQLFGAPVGQGSGLLLMGMYAFAFQIYYDFSGYTDIAIGAARASGFNLTKNFNRPYLSQSIHEFWRRWHISLSSWFRDYLYLPLGGNLHRYRNLLIVFTVSGLWHGANWTFFIWGLVHALYMIIGSVTAKARTRVFGGVQRYLPSAWVSTYRVIIVFHLVSLAWIPFRSPSLGAAATYVRELFRFDAARTSPIVLHYENFTIGLLGLLVMALIAIVENRSQVTSALAFRFRWARWTAYCCLALGLLLIGQLQARATFIYFQF